MPPITCTCGGCETCRARLRMRKSRRERKERPRKEWLNNYARGLRLEALAYVERTVRTV